VKPDDWMCTAAANTVNMLWVNFGASATHKFSTANTAETDRDIHAKNLEKSRV
jgi:hypothetical protein